MMCAPYQKIRNWTLAASYYKNTMYICEIDSEDRTNGLHLDQAHLDIAINNSWLEKLKQYCLSESNNRMPDPSQPLEKHGTFNCVFSTTISGIKMIFEAPMIVENSQNRCDAESNFVELKVRPTTMSQLEWSEYYLNVATKWWADCYLVGIDDLFIATCDKNGRIVHIKRTKSREIYKESEKYWSTAVCANFMARLLSTIKCTMIHLNSASTVYIYDFNAMNAQITYKVYEGRNRYTFIPDWYRMMLDNLENSMH
ncbi:protein cutoff [Scaptodrosophila lebanonensis]|uniref:Decapping nuclease n=1 Tax=Drosophila lebanonensis TaxID=7225 RepID=A0A6J2U153_DROLE|nr:protein cutoff [Scaptodrosophila lebanonensis]